MLYIDNDCHERFILAFSSLDGCGKRTLSILTIAHELITEVSQEDTTSGKFIATYSNSQQFQLIFNGVLMKNNDTWRRYDRA